MKRLLKTKTLSISILSKPEKVYKFVSDLKNLPKWAKTFCRSIRKKDGDWVVETAQGPLKIRIAGENDLGVLDHYLNPVSGGEIFVPIRVVPNAGGSEVIFTIFQYPGMSDKNFIEDARLVEKDLRTLKMVLEKSQRLE